VLTLDISNENIPDFSSSESDYEISYANASKSDSGRNDSNSETGNTPVSNWLEVTDLDPGPNITIPVQDTECEAVAPSSFDMRTEHVDYFYYFYDPDLLVLILYKTILNGNKKKIQNMHPTKRTTITDWSPPTLAGIKAMLGVVTNMSPHPASNIND
jgi:hypothetical protein